eukprot:13047909-Alexandrium_andersonii.AAC.1
MSCNSGLWDSPGGGDGYATPSRITSGPTDGTLGGFSLAPLALATAPTVPPSAPQYVADGGGSCDPSLGNA